MVNRYRIFHLSFLIISLCSCVSKPGYSPVSTGREALLQPDYSGIVIPSNIAPLNYTIREEGSAYMVRYLSGKNQIMEIFSRDPSIHIRQRKWGKMLEENTDQVITMEIYIRSKEGSWKEYNPVEFRIAKEPIDRYLVYRLIHPGYESWAGMSIEQRDLQDFKKHPVVENSIANENCVNCHSISTSADKTLMFHMRGNMGGTWFLTETGMKKFNLKTKEMKNGAVYPRWHPSGKFIAFSSNKIVQQFHSSDINKVEVSDIESSLVLYDVVKNEMMDLPVPGGEKSMDTYPEWSPDGKYLYFCRAAKVGENFNYQDIKYDLYRIPFDVLKKITGDPEMVFDASSLNKSVSFPRISPDGKFLVFTLHDYGCFPIWHKEADLWCINLSDRIASRMNLNSDFTDSYHSWSSNNRWMVFSSRRDDGLTTRPYISYIDDKGSSYKPFILPQQNPEFYQSFLRSYNVPELTNAWFDPLPGKIRKTAEGEAIPVRWSKSGS